MKVFCYDLMLAQLWSEKDQSPGFLIHDSTIFDPVDERQVIKALELAQSEASSKNFQYICTINSDKIPMEKLPEGFELNQYVRLRLTDKQENGSLLGINY